MMNPPQAGLPLIASGSAVPAPSGVATLEAQVNPEGNETTVHFEYVDEADFKTSQYANATSTPPISIGSEFTGALASAQVTLIPGTTYHYRVVATNSEVTATGEDKSFQETPPALILGPWASDVASTSVTIAANIDPLGANTTYRVEYGTGASYEHAFTGSVGEGTSYVTINRHIQELEPVTTYHYRIVTSNDVGEWQSADHTFTTEVASGELTLPDGRAWELVSPVDKHGTLIEPEPRGEVQAASDGSGIAYVVDEPITEKATANFSLSNQILSTRGSGGWSSQEYGRTEKLPEKENEPHQPFLDSTLTEVFSADLSQVVIEPGPGLQEPLSAQATERTLYLRDNSTGGFLPLVTPANVPQGTEFGGAASTYHGTEQEMQFLAATPDLRHVVFESPFRLTPEAVGSLPCANEVQHLICRQNLYEWSEGQLALVDVLPDGEPVHSGGEEEGPYLGRDSLDVIHAISSDGRRIVWTQGKTTGKTYKLYVRDMGESKAGEGKTVQIGGLKALFETASSDDSRIFYLEKSELYVFDVDTGVSTDVTADHGPGEHRAGVVDGFIMGAGEDGARVYYVARGVLSPGAASGEDNLYVSHYEGGTRTTTLIATLSQADEFKEPFFGVSEHEVLWERMDARISPNGRYLAFMSSRPLTGYDNTDAVSGQPDEEAYLYDAVSGRLACVSCDPSGARPTGIYEPVGAADPLVDKNGFWSEHWIAADLPLWHTKQTIDSREPTEYQPRYLSDSGRLFFDSSDALVPQDTNGLMDVYEYELSGVGNCTNESSTYSERSAGCVSLISSGASSGESAFMDASETGDDVFFVTSSQLVTEDQDMTGDVYDAHVCTVAVPCRTAPVLPPPCTSGDSCKAAPSPQPEIFGPAPSATFSGTGNVVVSPSSAVVAPKSLTRAQMLARALRACRKKKDKAKRATCERQARKRYRAKLSRKTKPTRKGNR